MGILDLFSSKPSNEKFGAMMLKAFQDAGYPHPMRFDLEEFQLLGTGENSMTFNLHNVYREYCSAEKKDREAIVSRFVSGMAVPAVPGEFSAARAHLLPILRGRSIAEYLLLGAGQLAPNAADALMSAPFSADSLLMLAHDTEFSMQTVPGAQLERWGVGFDEAFAIAVDNLRDASVSNFVEIVPGLFCGAWGDSYESSRILFPDLVYQLNVGGEPIVMIPSRHRFLVTSGNSTAGLLAMLHMASICVKEEGRAISALMYRYENGRPVEYVPTDPAVVQKAAELRHQFLADDYASQKDLLGKIHEKDGTDIFIASYQVVQSRDEEVIASLSVWTDEVDTLLPQTELVVLNVLTDAEGSAIHKVVKWDDLVAATGGMQPLPDRYPPLYRVDKHPPPDVVKSLQAQEL